MTRRAKAAFLRFKASTAGRSTGGGIVKTIVGITVGFIVAAALLPTAFTQIYNANTTGWNSAAVAVWNLLPLLGVVGLMIAVVAYAKLR